MNIPILRRRPLCPDLSLPATIHPVLAQFYAARVQDASALSLTWEALALALRTVISDWTAAYGVQPLLAETRADPARFTGHCYLTANRIDVGLTAGFGFMR